MNIRQLELLLLVLDSPTMTRAAEKLRLSPAAVSLQLRALASELKVELFVRTGKKLAPTPAALQLAERAREITRQMQQLREEFDNNPDADTRPFHFATGATTLIYRLGGPLRALRKSYPRLELHVTVSATEEMVAGLLDRKFDLALISLPVAQKELKIIPLFDEELLVVQPSSTQVRNRGIGSIRAEKLEGLPFLLYPRESNMRTIIDRFFHQLGLAPNVTMEAADTEVIKRLVESGFGSSILPEYALDRPSRFFRTLRIAGHRLVRRQAFAMMESGYSRALTESVATFLKDALEAREHRS